MKSELRLRGLVLPCFLWLVSAFLGFGAGAEAGIPAFFILTILLIFAVFVCVFGISGIHARRELPCASIACGDELDAFVHIRRKAGFPFIWVVVRDCCRHERTAKTERFHAFCLPWFQREFAVRYRLCPTERGEWRFGAVELIAGDFFGFVTISQKVELRDAFLAVPKPLFVPAGGADCGAAAAGLRPVGAHMPDGEANGVRLFAAGDPLSRIHWRASAKTGKLHAKVAEQPAENRLLVVLDASARGREEHKEPHAFEASVRMALGFSLAAANARLAATMVCTDKHYRRDLLRAPGYAHDRERRLALIAPDKTASLSRIFSEMRRRLPEETAVVLFTAWLDEETLRAAASWQERRESPLSLVWVSGASLVAQRERQLLQRFVYAGKKRTAEVYSAAGKRQWAMGGGGHGGETAGRIGFV
ncbi:MAG TPA: DUF58 domain-containing protein [Bacilli bacterium]